MTDLDECTKNLIYSSTIDPCIDHTIHRASSLTIHDEIFLGEACKNNDCETISKGIISTSARWIT